MDDIAAQFSFATPEDGPLKRALIRFIERLTGQPQLLGLYLENLTNPVSGESFFDAALRKLALSVDYDQARLDAVPKTGPLVFVSNHPFGVLDGLVACALANRARPDFKILINAVLTRPPEMAAYSLPIDFRETAEAVETNLRTRAEARLHLASGGALPSSRAGPSRRAFRLSVRRPPPIRHGNLLSPNSSSAARRALYRSISRARTVGRFTRPDMSA